MNTLFWLTGLIVWLCIAFVLVHAVYSAVCFAIERNQAAKPLGETGLSRWKYNWLMTLKFFYDMKRHLS